ncbi:MAG: hypothetical protein WCF03_14345, partial [Nitrososphaeraceae archaeon]
SGAGYYMLSTIYTLLVPMAAFKVLQSKLTTIDLNVDQSIAKTYRLAKCLLSSDDLQYRT